jgi:hypothetical protein
VSKPERASLWIRHSATGKWLLEREDAPIRTIHQIYDQLLASEWPASDMRIVNVGEKP